ncbi:MAG: BrnT family toxin [Aquisalimonadaceae bacterium]
MDNCKVGRTLTILASDVYDGNIHFMIDWTRIVGFNWDEGNGRKSADKHCVSQAEAEQTFFNEPLLLVSDLSHSQREPRFHALGQTDECRLLHVTFTLRAGGALIRVISARDMHRKERNFYEQSTKDST